MERHVFDTIATIKETLDILVNTRNDKLWRYSWYIGVEVKNLLGLLYVFLT